MKSNAAYLNISERRFFLRVIDILVILTSVYLAFNFFEFNFFDFFNPLIFGWILLFVIYFVLFGEIFQLYNLSVSNNRYLVFRSIVVTTFTAIIFYIFTPYITPELPPNRLKIVYLFLIVSIPILLWRFIYIHFIFTPKYFKNIVFIGESSKIENLLKRTNNDSFHNLVYYFSTNEIDGISGYRNILDITNDDSINKNFISEVIVSKQNLSEEVIDSLNEKLIQLFEKGVNIISYSKFYEEVTSRVPKEYLNHNFYNNINFSQNNDSRMYLFGVRFVDVLLSILGILLFLFVIPFILIGNLFANRGSLFYSQSRVGKNGKLFRIHKLRSMVKNAEANGAVWATKNDTRITKFGKFLRKTRLDELPQFFNILKGDMSLIGPRPERPEFVKDLEEQIPFYAIRHVVRPGLTGWAQVNYPYANTIEEQETKLRYDLFYIKERSSFLDFKILIKTITTVLYFRGQ